MIDHLLPSAGEGVLVDKAPVLGRDVVSHDLDVFGIAHPQPQLVSQPNELEGHGIEALDLGRDGINGHLVRRGQDDVLLVPAHGSRARPVAGESAVHHGEQSWVNVLLDHQQVHQRLVNDPVSPVPLRAQETSEGVLHRAGDGGEDVGFDGRHLNDVASDEDLRDVHPLRVDMVQHEEGLLGLVAHPVVLRLVEVDVSHAVLIHDDLLFVVALGHVGVHDDGVVMCTDEILVTIVLQGLDRALQLPGYRGAGGVPGLPGDVDLEDGLYIFGQGFLIARQMHQLPIVF